MDITNILRIGIPYLSHHYKMGIHTTFAKDVLRNHAQQQPFIVAPAVAVITMHLRKRPEWEKGEPFKVPGDLYQAASDEMAAIMKKRGFPLPVSKALKSNGVDNFLIFGTPIVSNG